MNKNKIMKTFLLTSFVITLGGGREIVNRINNRIPLKAPYETINFTKFNELMNSGNLKEVYVKSSHLSPYTYKRYRNLSVVSSVKLHYTNIQIVHNADIGNTDIIFSSISINSFSYTEGIGMHTEVQLGSFFGSFDIEAAFSTEITYTARANYQKTLVGKPQGWNNYSSSGIYYIYFAEIYYDVIMTRYNRSTGTTDYIVIHNMPPETPDFILSKTAPSLPNFIFPTC